MCLYIMDWEFHKGKAKRRPTTFACRRGCYGEAGELANPAFDDQHKDALEH